ncbi:hypothetical protein NIES22_41070 [Calothrix brevissima NIES-22]|nr:hypothetical protein NIES22_41070 [Calothrix brevissima NIES-22]
MPLILNSQQGNIKYTQSSFPDFLATIEGIHAKLIHPPKPGIKRLSARLTTSP